MCSRRVKYTSDGRATFVYRSAETVLVSMQFITVSKVEFSQGKLKLTKDDKSQTDIICLSVYCSMQFHVLKSSFSYNSISQCNTEAVRCSAKLSVSQCNTGEQARKCTEESISQSNNTQTVSSTINST